MASKKRKETSGQVTAAIIGGVFALLAAIIGGVFLILNTMVDKGAILVDTPTPNAFTKDQISPFIQSLNERGLIDSTNGSLLWKVANYPVTVSGQGIQTSFPSEAQVTDFVMYGEFTVSAKLDEFPYCGFVFRGDKGDEGNYYATFLGLDKGVVLWLHSGENFTPFNLNVKAEAVGNTKNNILLIAQGNQLTFLANDVIAYQVADDTFNIGRQGLSVGSNSKTNTCTFSNAWLWKIEKP